MVFQGALGRSVVEEPCAVRQKQWARNHVNPIVARASTTLQLPHMVLDPKLSVTWGKIIKYGTGRPPMRGVAGSNTPTHPDARTRFIHASPFRHQMGDMVTPTHM